MRTWITRWLWTYRRPDVPLAYWSRIGWFRFACWSWGVATLLAVVISPVVRRSLDPPILIILSLVLYCPFFWAGSRILRRRMLRDLGFSDFPLCLSCGYNLRGLPEERCPECGSVAKPEEVRLAWQAWAALRWGW